MPKSTLCRILKNSDKIRSECAVGHGKVKRLHSQDLPELEKCLVLWIKQCLDKNLPIGGPLIKEKALHFSQRLNIIEFKASNGWLEGFKKWNEVIFKKVW